MKIIPSGIFLLLLGINFAILILRGIFMKFSDLKLSVLRMSEEDKIQQGQFATAQIISYLANNLEDRKLVKSTFFGLIAPYFGVDKEIDKKELKYFKEITGYFDIDFDSFKTYVESYTKDEVIASINKFVDRGMPEVVRTSFIVLGLLIASSNGVITPEEEELLLYYVEK